MELAIVFARRAWLAMYLWPEERKGAYKKEKRFRQPSSTAEIR
jgi:hypothetical protein